MTSKGTDNEIGQLRLNDMSHQILQEGMQFTIIDRLGGQKKQQGPISVIGWKYTDLRAGDSIQIKKITDEGKICFIVVKPGGNTTEEFIFSANIFFNRFFDISNMSAVLSSNPEVVAAVETQRERIAQVVNQIVQPSREIGTGLDEKKVKKSIKTIENIKSRMSRLLSSFTGDIDGDSIDEYIKDFGGRFEGKAPHVRFVIPLQAVLGKEIRAKNAYHVMNTKDLPYQDFETTPTDKEELKISEGDIIYIDFHHIVAIPREKGKGEKVKKLYPFRYNGREYKFSEERILLILKKCLAFKKKYLTFEH